MSGLARQSTWRRLRLVFRWCRILFLLLLLLLLAAFLYFSHIGLPEFLKPPLQAELQRRGADLQFQRLSWRWYRGLVAETVILRATRDATGPRVHFEEVALNIKWGRLVQTRRLELESLRLRDGRAVIPLEAPGQPPEPFVLDGLQAHVRFLPADEWELAELQAKFLGATLRATGTITNASALTGQTVVLTGTNRAVRPALWREPLRRVLDVCRQMRFASPPEFRVRFDGDARDPRSFAAELRCQAAGGETPWIRLEDFRLTVNLKPSPPGTDTMNVALRLTVGDAITPWGEFEHADLTITTAHPLTNALPSQLQWDVVAQRVRGKLAGLRRAHLTGHSARRDDDSARWQTELTLSADGLTGDWGTAHTTRLAAVIAHSLTNLVPAQTRIEAQLTEVDTRWGKASAVSLAARAAPAGEAAGSLDPRRSWLAQAPAVRASWRLAVTNAEAPVAGTTLACATLVCDGEWASPRLALTNLQARLYGGVVDLAEAQWDTETGDVSARLTSDIEPHDLPPVLGAEAVQWLAQFRWAQPPRVQAAVRLRLPGPDPVGPDWAQRVLPTVVLDAAIEGRDAAYREVPIQQARLSVHLSNQVLHLRDFHLVRPEGDADLAYDLDTLTQEFRWRVRGNLDPKAVGPAIDSEAPRFLSLFEFHGPVQVAGEVWGRWGTNKQLNLALGGVATNFLFRGEAIEELRAGVRLTNEVLTATNVTLRTGDGWAQAASVAVDFRDSFVDVASGEAELDPMRFARALGSNLVNTLAPYRFDRPPRVRASGRVPTQGGVQGADMRFDVAGGPFHFWRFNVTNLQTTVQWQGDRVTITNAACGFYQGQLNGHMRVDVQPDGSADFSFRTVVTNVDLASLVADTIPTTNRIQGVLHGTLDIRQANSADWKSWNGAGRLQMRNGLLWDLPVFSILSPVLNAFVPGLGNSRASAATGSFTIDNSVMRTEDLAIVANPTYLSYRGTLDFDWNVRARVEAEVLPGMPLLGPVLNIVFAPVTKALVFRINGTLGKPELEPMYVPKFLMPIFRPFHTLKSVFPSASPTEPSPPADSPPKPAP